MTVLNFSHKASYSRKTISKLLVLHTACEKIPIYKWYAVGGEQGFAVAKIGEETKYCYFRDLEEAKSYIKKELS